MGTGKDRAVMKEGKFLRLVRRDGWEYVERKCVTGIVVLVALTDDDRLLLVEQYRVPLGARVIELPAGLAGDEPGAEHEDMADAARRELLEETGYEAGELELACAGPISAGLSNEVITVFVARHVKRVGAGGGDESEDIVVHAVPLAEVEDWLLARQREGIMVDSKVYAGIYFARRREG